MDREMGNVRWGWGDGRDEEGIWVVVLGAPASAVASFSPTTYSGGFLFSSHKYLDNLKYEEKYEEKYDFYPILETCRLIWKQIKCFLSWHCT